LTDIPSLEIGNSRDFGEVRAEVARLVHAISPGHEMAYIDHAFALAETASQGMLLGYSSLLTPYHDQGHMLEVVLCGARLLHGLHLAGELIDALTIDACIVGALLHDTGYLMDNDEVSGTGAQFTLTHVVRGAVFAETQLVNVLPPDLMVATSKVILATDHRPIAVMPEFSSRAQRIAAQVTATADLIGQMANREYLERLLLLYYEFNEAGITLFKDVHDLLEKTGSFYHMMHGRLQNELGNLTPHLTKHFDQARGVRRNFYTESVDRNLDYLANLVKEERTRRLDRLKRGNIVLRAIDLLGNET
jgi:hypothetical protein